VVALALLLAVVFGGTTGIVSTFKSLLKKLLSCKPQAAAPLSTTSLYLCRMLLTTSLVQESCHSGQ
jgi:hypothetical protein